MPVISELCSEHAHLRGQLDDLLRIVEAGEPDPAAAAAARSILAHDLKEHCAREDRAVYDWLLASGDAAATPVAWRYRKNYGQIATLFSRYVAEWPVSRLSAEWEAFREKTREVLAVVLERMAREEQVLYPHVRRLKARRSTTAADNRQSG